MMQPCLVAGHVPAPAMRIAGRHQCRTCPRFFAGLAFSLDWRASVADSSSAPISSIGESAAGSGPRFVAGASERRKRLLLPLVGCHSVASLSIKR